MIEANSNITQKTVFVRTLLSIPILVKNPTNSIARLTPPGLRVFQVLDTASSISVVSLSDDDVCKLAQMKQYLFVFVYLLLAKCVFLDKDFIVMTCRME